MARRLPSNPPNLPGFAFVRVLGSGGFADVFLYEQNMPRRLVAVKVLLAEVVNDDLRQMFQAEANLMAQLSSHPSILTVYQASVAADGRPYLVMEYCAATLGQRYRTVSLPLAEVLSDRRAHRQRRRDRASPGRAAPRHQAVEHPPTAYGHPVLSDFGIAATLGEAQAATPWASRYRGPPPRCCSTRLSGSVASEVWSLGATVYSLLAGRSPFEIPGGRERLERPDVAHRTGQAPADRPRRRAREPRALLRARDVAPAREQRPASALEFVRELQSSRPSSACPRPPIEIAMDDWALATVLDLDERTRITDASPIAESGPGRRRRRRGAQRTSGAQSGTEPSHDSASLRGRPTPPARRLVWGISAAAVLVVALAGAGTFVVLQGTRTIPMVTGVEAKIEGTTVLFTWRDPGLERGDAYIVTVGDEASALQRVTSIRVDASDGERVCATVTVTRDGKPGRPSAARCVQVEEDG